MIAECFNPACRRQLHYLREGCVVRVVTNAGSNVGIEHFWLCGDCCQTFSLQVVAEGKVNMVSRRRVHRSSTPETERYLLRA